MGQHLGFTAEQAGPGAAAPVMVLILWTAETPKDSLQKGGTKRKLT